jgi:hypothetical protein
MLRLLLSKRVAGVSKNPLEVLTIKKRVAGVSKNPLEVLTINIKMYDTIVIYGDNMNWIDEELNEIEKRRQEILEQKDMKPFLKLEIGENIVEFSTEKPRDNPRFAGRKVFRVKKDGEEYDFSVSVNSTLYRDILRYLKQGKTKLKIVRVGQGRNDTRYTVMLP